jgi:hypothetical protein
MDGTQSSFVLMLPSATSSSAYEQTGDWGSSNGLLSKELLGPAAAEEDDDHSVKSTQGRLMHQQSHGSGPTYEEEQVDPGLYSPFWSGTRYNDNPRNKNMINTYSSPLVGVVPVPNQGAARFLGRPYQAWEPKFIVGKSSTTSPQNHRHQMKVPTTKTKRTRSREYVQQARRRAFLAAISQLSDDDQSMTASSLLQPPDVAASQLLLLPHRIVHGISADPAYGFDENEDRSAASVFVADDGAGRQLSHGNRALFFQTGLGEDEKHYATLLTNSTALSY